MTEEKIKISPDICSYVDDDHTKLTLEISLPGVKKENIKFSTFTVLDKYIDDIPNEIEGKTRKTLHYFLSKPWEMNNKVHHPGI